MAPKPTVIIVFILKPLIASNITLYEPKRTNINEPDIPGSIIAQIAKAPDRNKNQLESDASIEGIVVI